MLEVYYAFFHMLMKYSYNIKTRSKKKSLNVYKYEGVTVLTLNDYPNRRLLVFFFKVSTKELFRVSYHGYHARPMRKRIGDHVKRIQEEEGYFEILKQRRSYSYRKERAYSNYMKYQNKLKG